MIQLILNILDESSNFYKAVYELNSLKDNELEELGLNRHEIPITVYNSMLQKYK